MIAFCRDLRPAFAALARKGQTQTAPVFETGAAKSERNTTRSSVVKLSQSAKAENPRAENFMRLSPGERHRDLEKCFISVRQSDPRYLVIYPNQKLFDKKWDRIVIDAKSTDGVITSLRIRKAAGGERGHLLHARIPTVRPTYDVICRGTITIRGDRRVLVEPRFDGPYCFIDIPQGWEYRPKVTL